jgi:hypothetical protein
MIVLDENLNYPILATRIAAWYPGRVAILTELRPKTTIKDDAVSGLLRTVPYPTFVTINVKDFWRVIRAEAQFAVVCIELPIDRAEQVSEWLRRYLSLPEFKTKAGRMGIVALLRPTRIEFYRADRKIETMDWSP